MTHVDHPFNNPKILSLCSGMRGIERGLERALGSIDVVTYVEREAFVLENLIVPMECGLLDSAPVWEDLRTFNAEPFYGRIHGIVGGYPCQGESVAGNMLGTKDPRFLWWDIERIIKAIDPVWCYFENVRNHINQSFPLVLASLRAMGYRVESGIFSAEEIDAPHKRERFFILAIKLGNTQYNGPHGQQESRSNGTSSQGTTQGKVATQQSQGASRSGNGSGLSGSELADSNESRLGRGHESGIQSEAQRKSKEMALANIERLQDKEFRGTSDKDNQQKESLRPASKRSIYDRWPKGQGPEQWDWEAPRTVESGLGCTIDGYNFREDLLRMYGNGVVEQTSEFAFLTLLKKHGIKL